MTSKHGETASDLAGEMTVNGAFGRFIIFMGDRKAGAGADDGC